MDDRAGQPPNRRIAARWSAASLPDPVYRELVDMLFSMMLPVVAMGVALTCMAVLIADWWHDLVAAAAAAAALVLTIGRAALILVYKAGCNNARPAAHLRRWERLYALGSYAFALLLGALNVWVLRLEYPMLHLIAVSLVFAFGAGIVSRVSIRPMICTISLLLAVVPTTIGLAVHTLSHHGGPLHSQLFAVEGLLVAGIAALSLQSVHHLYRSTVEHLVAKHDLGHLARQDALTGLANRLLLRERFQQAVSLIQSAGSRLALHIVDLDGFKSINDRYGHLAGDAVLVEVAIRLRSMVRAGDTVARLGGDEFAVLQVGLNHESEAELLARRIIRQLSAPYQLEQELSSLSASVGIAVAPEKGTDLEHLVACADAALYRSKTGGKGQLHFCTDEDTTGPRGRSPEESTREARSRPHRRQQ